MADEYYNDTVFEGKTFADLLKKPQGSVPFLVLNSTDISINHRFEFTQDQFDLLCSDLLQGHSLTCRGRILRFSGGIHPAHPGHLQGQRKGQMCTTP